MYVQDQSSLNFENDIQTQTQIDMSENDKTQVIHKNRKTIYVYFKISDTK